MGKNNGTGKRLHLIPLILGGYGAFLGLGLMAAGLFGITEGIGIIRFVLGLGMAGFGLLGIWDGVRDLARPAKKPEKAPASQFILTDTSGNRSSNVTPELLRKQMDILAEGEDCKSFYLQILPPLPAGEDRMLNQVSCVYHGNIILAALFEMPKDGYRIYQKSTEPGMATEWLGQLLAGNPDFTGWENIETDTPQDEGAEPFWYQLWASQKGTMAYWHKLLVIFGESWHDEHKFFSSRDLELAMEGVHSGKYQKAVLEWGCEAFNIFPGQQSDLMVVWCKNNGAEKATPRLLAREGTVTQVKFWLANYLEHGFLEETDNWSDITAQIEKERKKGGKKHGKVL